MKAIVIASTAAFAFAASVAQASPELAKSSGCTNCHDVSAKKVGPSFKSVAEKYKGKADAEDKLVAELREGKKHPKVAASEADTKTLVKWVLSQ